MTAAKLILAFAFGIIIFALRQLAEVQSKKNFLNNILMISIGFLIVSLLYGLSNLLYLLLFILGSIVGYNYGKEVFNRNGK